MSFFCLTNDPDHCSLDRLRAVVKVCDDNNIKISHSIHVCMKQDGSKLSDHSGVFDTGCLKDNDYARTILQMKDNGHEICYHGYSQISDTRHEFLKGLEIFEQTLGFFPKFYIEHGGHTDTHNIDMVTSQNLSKFGSQISSKHYVRDILREFDGVWTQKMLKFERLNAHKEEDAWYTIEDGIKFFCRVRNVNLQKVPKHFKNAIGYTHFGYEGYHHKRLWFKNYFKPQNSPEVWNSEARIKKAIWYLKRFMEEREMKSGTLTDLLQSVKL